MWKLRRNNQPASQPHTSRGQSGIYKVLITYPVCILAGEYLSFYSRWFVTRVPAGRFALKRFRGNHSSVAFDRIKRNVNTVTSDIFFQQTRRAVPLTCKNLLVRRRVYLLFYLYFFFHFGSDLSASSVCRNVQLDNARALNLFWSWQCFSRERVASLGRTCPTRGDVRTSYPTAREKKKHQNISRPTTLGRRRSKRSIVIIKHPADASEGFRFFSECAWCWRIATEINQADVPDSTYTIRSRNSVAVNNK